MTALIVLGLWSPNLMRPPPPAWTPYVSVKGQIRRLLLADKSVLRLNGASQVRVVYEEDDRRLALGQAEAALLIIEAPARPFLIAAGDREVRTTGGEVDVLRQTAPSGSRTILTIRRGHARIYPLDQPEQGLDAGPGDEVSWIDGQPLAQVRKVNADNAFAWESRRLAYDRAPLSAVVADLNRHVDRPIRIADPSLAALPFSGVLTLEGEDLMLRKIGAVLPIQAKSVGAQMVLTRRAPCPPKGCGKPAKKQRGPNPLQALLGPRKPKPHAPPRLLPLPAPPLKP
jgi:transmembrane sensor